MTSCFLFIDEIYVSLLYTLFYIPTVEDKLGFDLVKAFSGSRSATPGALSLTNTTVEEKLGFDLVKTFSVSRSATPGALPLTQHNS